MPNRELNQPPNMAPVVTHGLFSMLRISPNIHQIANIPWMTGRPPEQATTNQSSARESIRRWMEWRAPLEQDKLEATTTIPGNGHSFSP